MRWNSVSSIVSQSFSNTALRYFSFDPSRDFQFKVKGISMSVFNEDDVRALSNEGNIAFNAKYLANYNTHDPLPNGSDVNKLKEFIKSKYLDKRWHVDSSSGRGGGGGGDNFGAFDNNNTGNTNRRASTGGRGSVRACLFCSV